VYGGGGGGGGQEAAIIISETKLKTMGGGEIDQPYLKEKTGRRGGVCSYVTSGGEVGVHSIMSIMNLGEKRKKPALFTEAGEEEG